MPARPAQLPGTKEEGAVPQLLSPAPAEAPTRDAAAWSLLAASQHRYVLLGSGSGLSSSGLVCVVISASSADVSNGTWTVLLERDGRIAFCKRELLRRLIPPSQQPQQAGPSALRLTPPGDQLAPSCPTVAELTQQVSVHRRLRQLQEQQRSMSAQAPPPPPPFFGAGAASSSSGGGAGMIQPLTAVLLPPQLLLAPPAAPPPAAAAQVVLFQLIGMGRSMTVAGSGVGKKIHLGKLATVHELTDSTWCE